MADHPAAGRRRRESRLHRPQRVMEPRLDRALRPAGAVRHVRQRQVGEVVQHDDHPLVGIEERHRSHDLVPLQDAAERIGLGDRLGDRVERDEAHAAATTQAVAADVDQDAVEPGLEAVGVAQGPGRPPGAKERLLGRVLGLDLVAQEQAGQPIGAVQLSCRQATEAIRGIGAGVARGFPFMSKTRTDGLSPIQTIGGQPFWRPA